MSEQTSTQNISATANTSGQSAASKRKHKDSIHMGIMLVAIGFFFLLDRMDYLDARDYFKYWPALIAFSGVICVVRAERMSEVLDGFFQIGIGAWLYAVTQHLYGLTFSNSWPLFVIAAGLNMVFKYFVDKPNN
ncbi:LiaI-LiaF-like domain-containing protein [Undibacterium sp. Di24W]|uniref:LiaI-LiaF-like domain-containing protein n=1 Tax=Undibacterium sp. Di24W TaxID=3413033 RepID=UPI003BF43F97